MEEGAIGCHNKKIRVRTTLKVLTLNTDTIRFPGKEPKSGCDPLKFPHLSHDSNTVFGVLDINLNYYFSSISLLFSKFKSSYQ